MKRHSLYQVTWYLVSAALAISVILGIYSIGWEYSTRRYLKGFSDAIIPASSSAENKVEAILNWMARGPARQTVGGPDPSVPDRDPTETLNYVALLKVCGTATNAFVNLADSGGLEARRVLLLDSRNMTKHVSAEVLVNGRWIVVDPTYRTILRGPDGATVTLNQLLDPAIFATATQRIPGYNPEYSYGQTVHLRMGRLSVFGAPLFAILDRVAPGWSESTIVSLLAERESLVAVLASILLIAFLFLLRVGLRWYGEKKLGVRTNRVREQLVRAWRAFLKPADSSDVAKLLPGKDPTN
ncbi:MAG: transglutaminase domain-containing protein [Candidatus Acidiferrales bacterium]